MQVIRIEARNFKSFGTDGVMFHADSGLNMIVGENNVGKSNIIRILGAVHERLEGKAFGDEDYHDGRNEIPIAIKISATLDDPDVESLMEQLLVPTASKKYFLRLFGLDLIINLLDSPRSGLRTNMNMGNMNIQGSKGCIIADHSSLQSYQLVTWRSLVELAEREGRRARARTPFGTICRIMREIW